MAMSARGRHIMKLKRERSGYARMGYMQASAPVRRITIDINFVARRASND